MRAARFLGPGQPIEVVETADPVPDPNEVVVEVAACGICASDVHLVLGQLAPVVSPPLTLGHEASGTVVEVGDEVPVWAPGRRVSVMGGKACLACRRCVAGRLEECLDPRIMGVHYDGAWATHVVVPWQALAALPDAVSFEHGAIACDAVATPFSALTERGDLRPGERVGLWGIGGLGTHAVQIARMMGAGFIAAIDPLPTARERALALGADVALEPGDDVPGVIRTASGGRGLDLALDLVGSAAVVRQAMACLERRGRVVMVGQSLETVDTGPIVLMSVRGIGLLGHLGYRKADLERVLDLVASGRLDLSSSISGRVPLDRIEEGIARLTSKEDSPVRIVVTPQA